MKINKKIVSILMTGSIVLASMNTCVTYSYPDTEIIKQAAGVEMDKLINEAIETIEEYNYEGKYDKALSFIDDEVKKMPFDSIDHEIHLANYYNEKTNRFNWFLINLSIKKNSKDTYYIENKDNYSICSNKSMNKYLKIIKEYILELVEEYPEIDKKEVACSLAGLKIYEDNREVKDSEYVLGDYSVVSDVITINTNIKDEEMINQEDILRHELTHMVQDSCIDFYLKKDQNYTLGFTSHNYPTFAKNQDLMFKVMLDWVAEKCCRDISKQDMKSYSYYQKYVDLLETCIDITPNFEYSRTLIRNSVSNNTRDFLNLYQVNEKEDMSELYKLLYMIDALNDQNSTYLDEAARLYNIDNPNDIYNKSKITTDLTLTTMIYGGKILSKNLIEYVSKDSYPKENIDAKFFQYYSYCVDILDEIYMEDYKKEEVLTILDQELNNLKGIVLSNIINIKIKIKEK